MTEYDKAAVFLCFNQERFVAEAIRSLLGQTERVHCWLLDDASVDNTWQQVTACVNEFGVGADSHKIEALPAAVNGGLARNWNRVIPHLREEWVYVFEGDDVSMPERISICAGFARAHPSVAVMSSRVLEVSPEASVEVPVRGSGGVFDASRIATAGFPELPGCSLAIRREVFTRFGRLNWRLLTVDAVLIRRALMLGDLGLLEEILVSYRKHDGNVSRIFNIRYDSFAAFRDSMLAIQRHTLGNLHESRKLWRYSLDAHGAGSAQLLLSERFYAESTAYAALGLALAGGSRPRVFLTAALNMVTGKERHVSKIALALAVWSRAWQAWSSCKHWLKLLGRQDANG